MWRKSRTLDMARRGSHCCGACRLNRIVRASPDGGDYREGSNTAKVHKMPPEEEQKLVSVTSSRPRAANMCLSSWAVKPLLGRLAVYAIRSNPYLDGVKSV
jgi:hypothetical protein